ncbi:apolipoprotein D and lipocalin family protein [Jannaschia faecimaris]|uniref:Apolipoprotein D and lipocalin family protein n=1 Tax=Jannaschia faecimaris TaxID=1244108 RepID=A0A1H3L427_9RHOB|nr:lipocalin family protein [Jannaschia faecimaris]SDY59267.1 apolipoprotein D and lipocalin family protein [Jannaschia faecimaris]
MRALLPFVLVLAACQPNATLTSGQTYRDPTAIIASKADFDLTAFAGDWHEVARFPGSAGCAGAQVRFTMSGTAALRQTVRCSYGSSSEGTVQVAPLGRLIIADASGSAPVWVLWADTGYRTAILVSPDGTGGQILNRTPALPVDRLRAALEVLDFNGFDSGALVFP